MIDERRPADLACLVAGQAALVPAAQARLDALVEPGLRKRADASALHALGGPPSVPRITRSDFAIETLVGIDQTAGAGLAVWPVGAGFSILHAVRASHAARIAFSVIAAPA